MATTLYLQWTGQGIALSLRRNRDLTVMSMIPGGSLKGVLSKTMFGDVGIFSRQQKMAGVRRLVFYENYQGNRSDPLLINELQI